MSRYLGNEMAVAWDRQPEHAAPATRDALSAVSHRLMFDVTANRTGRVPWPYRFIRYRGAEALLDAVPRIAEPNTRTEAERRYDEARAQWSAGLGGRQSYSGELISNLLIRAADALRAERRTR